MGSAEMNILCCRLICAPKLLSKYHIFVSVAANIGFLIKTSEKRSKIRCASAEQTYKRWVGIPFFMYAAVFITAR